MAALSANMTPANAIEDSKKQMKLRVTSKPVKPKEITVPVPDTTSLPTNARIAIVYVRVSSEKQRVSQHGAEQQEAQARDYAARKGFVIPENGIYYDLAVSGKDMINRPQFQEMIKILKPGMTLIVKDISRLGRNVQTVTAFYSEMKEKGVAIVILDMDELDTSTANGALVFNMMVTIREFERSSANERTAAVFENMKKNNCVLGRAPFGFKIVKKALVPHDEEMKVVERIAEIIYEDKKISFSKIADILNKEGVVIRKAIKVWPSQVASIYKRHELEEYRKELPEEPTQPVNGKEEEDVKK
jgi:DNA invertase Pin-like site-specific DNA recombinase